MTLRDFVFPFFLSNFAVAGRGMCPGPENHSDMHTAYILLGGNQGRVATAFSRALDMLEKRAGKLIRVSPLYESEPWGMGPAPAFFNQAACLQTTLSPPALMEVILEVEAGLGRRRSHSGTPESRVIDIDLLFYDGDIMDGPGLYLPHPRLHLRRFALQPLADIAPGLMHPVLNKNVSQLLRDCGDPLWVRRVEGDQQAVS